MKTIYPERSRSVFVGLSGGVDSAVSAALLKKRGYSVVGAFIKIWRPEFTECTWKEDRQDAMRVCAALEIPYEEIDLSEEYKREVVDSMVRDYSKGITPNPDVLCNQSIKFGHFAKWALGRGADMIATGHYARVVHENGTCRLLRGIDTGKDQSYFLHRVGQIELSRTLFPVGDLKKSEVRALAKKFDLPVAKKHDSQGLCFVGDITMSEFLSRFLRLEKGTVFGMEGTRIGEHEGAALYTPGQRHGFSVFGSVEPHYVVSIDTSRNSIVVSPRREDAARLCVSVTDLHWIVDADASDISAQGRYRETPFPVLHEGGGKFLFDEPRVLAPGQSLVLYRGDECLGGGPIVIEH